MDNGRGATTHHGAILPLPADVVAQIKSSTTITSLTDVVVELFKNALDAGATKLEATVDFGRGGCTVEDNGLGIPPQEFRESGGLGRMYYTSRYNCGDANFGRNGTFLASLAAMSLLTMTSHHHDHRSHNTMTLHHCKPIARQTPAPSHHYIIRDHGTRVTVRDLFGNMPVRVKQRALMLKERSEHDRLWEALKKAISGLLLGWQRECSIKIQDADRMRNLTLNGQASASLQSLSESTGEKRRAPELQYMLNILTQASYITHEDWKSWVAASASTSAISIKGAISLEPAPSKRTQFLSLDIRPLSADSGHNELYDEINRLFSLSSFGAIEDDVEVDDGEKESGRYKKRFKSDGFTNRQLKGARKGIDKWPMFSLRIVLRDSSATSIPESTLLESESKLQSVVEVLRAMLIEWLSIHHFRLRKRQMALDKPRSICSSPGEAKMEVYSPRELHPFFGRSNTEPELERASTPNAMSDRKIGNRKRSTPSATRPTSQSKMPGEAHRYAQPFTDWSRIKSGNNRFYDTLWNASKSSKKEDSHDHEDSVQSTAFPSFRDKPILPGSLGTSRRSERISSHFSTPTAVAQPTITVEQNENVSELESSERDETFTWANPAINQTFLVNTRTGCVVPGNSQRPHDSSVAKGTTLVDFNKPLRLPQRGRPAIRDESSTSWLSGVLNDWDNPVFRQAEKSISQISINGPLAETAEINHFKHNGNRIDFENIFKEASHAGSSKLSKDALQHATVIAQVDKKFILVKMQTGSNVSNSLGTVLVLVDQHAADERIRVESLLSELCAPVPTLANQPPFYSNLGYESQVSFTILTKPMAFSLPSHDTQLFRTHAPTFAAWGILYNLLETQPESLESNRTNKLTVTTLPPAIAERCKSDPKLLVDLLRAEVYKLSDAPARTRANASRPHTESGPAATQSWLQRIGACPTGLLDMVNSRACRSAIMFNDALSIAECEDLVRKVGRCAFPFQCAHGRPSMVPVVDLGVVEAEDWENNGGFGGVFGRNEKEESSKGFGDAFRAWKAKESLDTENV